MFLSGLWGEPPRISQPCYFTVGLLRPSNLTVWRTDPQSWAGQPKRGGSIRDGLVSRVLSTDVYCMFTFRAFTRHFYSKRRTFVRRENNNNNILVGTVRMFIEPSASR